MSDADVLAKALAPGEELLWAGRPPRGFALRPDDWFEALGLLTAELLQLAVAVGVGGPAVAVFNGLATAAAGTRVFHRLWTVPRRRRLTWYGLTADRLLVVVTGTGAEVQSVRLADVAQVDIEEWKDGGGVVRVRGAGPRAAELAVIELVMEARQVYDQIRTACRRSRLSPGPPLAR